MKRPLDERAIPEFDADFFRGDGGVFVPVERIHHRDEEYDPLFFDVLQKMQREHFWYVGRHKFLCHMLKKELSRIGRPVESLSAIDIGGGCGGWLEYLQRHSDGTFWELALGDSSLQALTLAKSAVGPNIKRFQIDLLNLKWKNRWDVVFLLDVLEHIRDDISALREIRKILRPRGLLFVTAPALKFFWSYDDEVVLHQRRYSRGDFRRCAGTAGLSLIRSRYFMFFLSPLLLARKLRHVDNTTIGTASAAKLIEKTHKVPMRPINSVLSAVFSAESPLGVRFPFPWGTSILGVFQNVGIESE